MKITALTKTVAFTLTLIAFAAISRADLIVDTGPGTGGHYLLGGGSINQQLGAQFVLTELTDITSVKGWITTATIHPGDDGVGGQLDISIRADSATTPGATLFSSSTNLAGGLSSDWYGLDGLNWVLGPGTYWVVFGSPDGNPLSGSPQFGYMQVSPPSPLGAYMANNSILDFEWTQANSIGVQISANVPDQGATLPLLGLALVGLAWLRRREAA